MVNSDAVWLKCLIALCKLINPSPAILNNFCCCCFCHYPWPFLMESSIFCSRWSMLLLLLLLPLLMLLLLLLLLLMLLLLLLLLLLLSLLQQRVVIHRAAGSLLLLTLWLTVSALTIHTWCHPTCKQQQQEQQQQQQ